MELLLDLLEHEQFRPVLNGSRKRKVRGPNNKNPVSLYDFGRTKSLIKEVEEIFIFLHSLSLMNC